jgi:hypothetical protein
MDVIASVEGDGFVGWWEGLLRFGDAERDVPRVIESFRLAGLEGLADVVSQTSFCRDVVAAGIASDAEEFQFSTEQEQLLDRLDRQIDDRAPDAREALLKFLPRIPA